MLFLKSGCNFLLISIEINPTKDGMMWHFLFGSEAGDFAPSQQCKN
jgi:hypothetical protein